MDKLLGWLKFLVPPSRATNGEDHSRVTGWRWAIFVAVTFLMFNVAMSRGLVWGIGALAAASEVEKVSKSLDTVLELQYAVLIRDLHKQICSMPSGNRTSLQTTLDDYQRRYREITGTFYPLQACPAP